MKKSKKLLFSLAVVPSVVLPMVSASCWDGLFPSKPSGGAVDDGSQPKPPSTGGGVVSGSGEDKKKYESLLAENKADNEKIYNKNFGAQYVNGKYYSRPNPSFHSMGEYDGLNSYLRYVINMYKLKSSANKENDSNDNSHISQNEYLDKLSYAGNWINSTYIKNLDAFLEKKKSELVFSSDGWDDDKKAEMELKELFEKGNINYSVSAFRRDILPFYQVRVNTKDQLLANTGLDQNAFLKDNMDQITTTYHIIKTVHYVTRRDLFVRYAESINIAAQILMKLQSLFNDETKTIQEQINENTTKIRELKMLMTTANLETLVKPFADISFNLYLSYNDFNTKKLVSEYFYRDASNGHAEDLFVNDLITFINDIVKPLTYLLKLSPDYNNDYIEKAIAKVGGVDANYLLKKYLYNKANSYKDGSEVTQLINGIKPYYDESTHANITQKEIDKFIKEIIMPYNAVFNWKYKTE